MGSLTKKQKRGGEAESDKKMRALAVLRSTAQSPSCHHQSREKEGELVLLPCTTQSAGSQEQPGAIGTRGGSRARRRPEIAMPVPVEPWRYSYECAPTTSVSWAVRTTTKKETHLDRARERQSEDHYTGTDDRDTDT